MQNSSALRWFCVVASPATPIVLLAADARGSCRECSWPSALAGQKGLSGLCWRARIGLPGRMGCRPLLNSALLNERERACGFAEIKGDCRVSIACSSRQSNSRVGCIAQTIADFAPRDFLSHDLLFCIVRARSGGAGPEQNQHTL